MSDMPHDDGGGAGLREEAGAVWRDGAPPEPPRSERRLSQGVGGLALLLGGFAAVWCLWFLAVPVIMVLFLAGGHGLIWAVARRMERRPNDL